MGRLGLSFRAFWRVLRNPAFADKVRRIIDDQGAAPAAVAEVAKPVLVTTPVPAARPAPKRSEALTLLAVLQREARLVDFLKEDIAGYADDQVGAAVREIHRDAAAALDRIFALKPIRTEGESATVTIPAGYDAGRVRLVGNVTGNPPHTGTLAHAGWEAARAELPAWNGTDAAATVVAPAEVELR